MNQLFQFILIVVVSSITADMVDPQHTLSFFTKWQYWAVMGVMLTYGIANYVEGRTKQ